MYNCKVLDIYLELKINDTTRIFAHREQNEVAANFMLSLIVL